MARPKKKDEKAPDNVIVDGDAVVLDVQGNVVRTYSLRVHGEGYGKLAKQFADKNADKKYRVREA